MRVMGFEPQWSGSAKPAGLHTTAPAPAVHPKILTKAIPFRIGGLFWGSLTFPPASQRFGSEQLEHVQLPDRIVAVSKICACHHELWGREVPLLRSARNPM